MNDPEGLGLNEIGRQPNNASETHPRAVGAPLPMGSGARTPLPVVAGDGQKAVPPPGRALVNSPLQPASDLQPSGLQRAMSALRMALPLVQRILPLLDGNIGTAVSNLLSPHPQPAPHAPQVNLEPIEDGLAQLQTGHRELRDQVVEQNASLKRVEDQLEMVREATDRNTLEQQELLEDLKAVGNKVNAFAFLALGLLAASILLNIILYLHIKRVLP